MVRGKRVAFIRAREEAEHSGNSIEVWHLERGMRRKKLGVVHPSWTLGRIVLIGCSRMQRQDRTKAADFYTSPLFKKQLELSKHLHASAEALIVSPEYGLVSMGKPMRPHEASLVGKSAESKKDWADWVIDDLLDRMACRFHKPGWEEELESKGAIRSLEVVLLLGSYQAKLLRAAAPEELTFSEPMAGLRIGERLRWLNRAITNAKRTRRTHPA